ncbi:ornithine cyclodeaminase family protein [Phenylobacterium sp.]|uniref:ornithine cyclodeaminase family protein n=1 Tax=Phenylobacterium sp. TaxID=1871053 RepID=UPI002730404D|nr:ornithine cyclodeaminase family protein [Phenylobacterium sp.]MDP1618063.1 ornithine cyclodeaminase family protein [Phenylobacterium sp.]MDP1987290.1 ornithine cyclodeaminase family protein [Phenylobacterium sp.]
MSAVALISDAQCAKILAPADALACMRALFAQMAAGEADNFPVIRERPGLGDCVYGIKSGVNRASGLLGLKIGGYWPGNTTRGMARHQSTVVLTDPESGVPIALVGGNVITALRTAASAALSVDVLARRDAKVLGIIGAGGQALWHARAVLAVRDFDQVLVWNRTPEAAARLASALGPHARPAATADALVSACDVVVTITGATTPLFSADAVRPGTHFACMGSDTAGKGETPDGLLRAARLFVDSTAQALTLGECQRVPERAEALTPLGGVILGRAPGRVSDDDVTLFDGTGLGLQDLAMAQLVLSKASQTSETTVVEI